MIVLAAVSLFASSTSAQCAPPPSAQAVLECALQHDPDVKLASARRLQAEAGVGASRQFLNPELSGKSVSGDGASKAELDLSQAIEIGGKRAARVGHAQAGQDAAAAELAAVQAATVLKTVSSLYRVRQAQAELSIIEEALRTFSSIGKQLGSRPRLAPEQEVSRLIFELAEADYALKKASLVSEMKALLKSLSVSVGAALTLDGLPLPPPQQDWPAVPKSPSAQGAEVLAALAGLKAAEADRKAAQAAAWPDLRAGPSIERDTEAGVRRQTIGFNLGMALPLWNRNAAGRRQARRGEEAAALSLEAVRARVAAERETEKARYEAAVEALKLAADRKDIHSKHEKVEDFFQRGLISSSLVIEAHRQIFEFTRDRHEHELTATRALWRIRALDGRVLGEKL